MITNINVFVIIIIIIIIVIIITIVINVVINIIIIFITVIIVALCTCKQAADIHCRLALAMWVCPGQVECSKLQKWDYLAWHAICGRTPGSHHSKSGG